MLIIFAGILLTLAVFMFIVFIHELGHFLGAKLFGVKVEEFGIGIPPRALTLGHDKSGTAYTLNYLPLGGFVRIAGEEMEPGKKPSKNDFSGKSFVARSVILLAGVFGNFLLAVVLLTLLFWSGVGPMGVNLKIPLATETKLILSPKQAISSGFLTMSGVRLEPLTGGVAYVAGVQEGDLVESINQKKVASPDEFVAEITASPSKVDLVLSRSGKLLNFSLSPKDGKINTSVGYDTISVNTGYVYKYPLKEAFTEGVKETYAQSAMMLELLGKLGKNLIAPQKPNDREEAAKSMAGPIALGKVFVGFLENGFNLKVLLLFVVLISINLGVFNLLPLPALDGGRFVFICIGQLLKPFDKKQTFLTKFENHAHTIGFTLLILISILIAFKDILALLPG